MKEKLQRWPPAGVCGSAGLGVDVHSGTLEKRMDTRPVGIRSIRHKLPAGNRKLS